MDIYEKVDMRRVTPSWLSPIYATDAIKVTQLDPAYSSSVISNCPLLRTKTHFPRTCPLVRYYWLFRTPDISNYFSLPLTVQKGGVQLYIKKLVLRVTSGSAHIETIKALRFRRRASFVLNNLPRA